MRLPASSIANISKILCFFDFSHQSCLLGDHLACKLTQKCSINQIWTKKYSRLIVETVYFLLYRRIFAVAAIGGGHCKTNDNR